MEEKGVDMEEIINKARILVEALPYIREFNGKTFVIKYGGSVMENSDIKRTIMEDITLLKYVGVNPVIVHGGGPVISNNMKKFNKDARFINGLRVTDRETMEIVEMTLVGLVNKEIVSIINQLGGKAVGISGKDGQLIKASKLFTEDSGVVLGFVGQVEEVNPGILLNLTEGGYIPVISPIGSDNLGNTYNINADTVAGKMAASLGAEKLILLTDVDGIYSEPGNDESLVSSLTVNEINRWIEEKKIRGGMIPKVKAGIEALQKGVNKIHILNGQVPHSLLLEIFTERGIGTMIVADRSEKDE